MNLSQFKPFKQYSFYNDSIYNQIFENVTRHKTRPYCTCECGNKLLDFIKAVEFLASSTAMSFQRSTLLPLVS